ncbi:DUF2306 domain-containing protein [Myxococcota bacterium]|nr:DUF2306 domain-containing protein [Myxococcota bacterium]
MKRLKPADLQVPAMLIVLSIVPTIGGAARIGSLTRGVVTAEDARFFDAPTPIVVHVLSATLFSLLGALQFSKGLRLRWPAWHRGAGRLLAIAGLVAGVTGLWMTVAYAIPRGMQGPLLAIVRVAVGAAMIASIVVAVRAILRRDVARHEAFMIRAYALGQGAGTQALVLGPWMLLTGESLGATRDVLMTLAWLINVAVAELIIRRPSPRRSRISGTDGAAAR